MSIFSLSFWPFKHLLWELPIQVYCPFCKVELFVFLILIYRKFFILTYYFLYFVSNNSYMNCKISPSCLFFILILLKYSWFTMLCWFTTQFQVFSKVIQLYRYIYSFFFRFFSLLVYHRILSRVPCAKQYVLVGYLSYIY